MGLVSTLQEAFSREDFLQVELSMVDEKLAEGWRQIITSTKLMGNGGRVGGGVDTIM
jgi:hypothetical protein